MAARRFVMVCIESSYGTAKTTPVLGTDKFYARLDRDNAFTVIDEPVQLPVMYGGGVAIESCTAMDSTSVKGGFSFRLAPGAWSDILLPWAITGINSGRTTPWTTTDASVVMPVGDYASLSFYEAVLKEDGTTYDRKVYRGCKCDDWELTASETGDGRVWNLSGTMTGIRAMGNPWDSSTDPDATEFPAPAETDYPCDWWLFSHLATGTGSVSVGGVERKTSCSGVRLRGRNTFAPNFYTSRFLSTYRWVGRSCQAEIDLRYKATPDDRASWRNMTAQTVLIKLDTGVKTLLLDYKTKNLLRPWSRAVPNESEYMQTLTLANRWDAAAAVDLTVTLT
jgi:hypothetical protein